jgi:hypothetical protein
VGIIDQIKIIHRDRAGVGLKQRRQNLHQGGFAGAVRSFASEKIYL